MNYVFGELSTTLTISKSSFFKLKGVSEKQNNLSPQNLLKEKKMLNTKYLSRGRENKDKMAVCVL